MAFSIIGFFKKIGLLRSGSGTWRDDDYFTSSVAGTDDAPAGAEDTPDDSGDDGGFDDDGGDW